MGRVPKRPANGLANPDETGFGAGAVALDDGGPAVAAAEEVVVSRSENPDESDVAAGE